MASERFTDDHDATKESNLDARPIGHRALLLRTPEHAVDNFFLKRWSPRALEPIPVIQDDLLSIFEAARWAPSTFNEQEWRFLYGVRETPDWPLFFEALVAENQVWCKNAGALVCI